MGNDTPGISLVSSEFMTELQTALTEQLVEDTKRWGDTWRRRGLKGQEKRTMERYRDYYDRFKNAGVPMPWLKIIGGAYICWLREKHPELLLCDPNSSCESVDV